MEEKEVWTFDWHKEPEGFTKWLFVNLITGNREQFNQISEATKGSSDVQITVQINGIEVDPKMFFEAVEKTMDLNVAREAQALIRTKYESLDEAAEKLSTQVYAISEVVQDALEEHLRQLGLEVPPRDDDPF